MRLVYSPPASVRGTAHGILPYIHTLMLEVVRPCDFTPLGKGDPFPGPFTCLFYHLVNCFLFLLTGEAGRRRGKWIGVHTRARKGRVWRDGSGQELPARYRWDWRFEGVAISCDASYSDILGLRCLG